MWMSGEPVCGVSDAVGVNDVSTTTNATITTATTISPSSVVSVKNEIEDEPDVVILKMVDSRHHRSQPSQSQNDLKFSSNDA